MIKGVKLYLFDMDGTLYLGDRLFSFTKDLLKRIKEDGHRYMFMTNNSSKSVEAYINKLMKLGIESRKSDFITSSMATIHYIKENYIDKTFYVCGTTSLIDEFTDAGIKITSVYSEAEAIVMGYDTELTYKKLEDVCKILLSRDVPYIATNPDYVCPTEYGSVPDCGSVCDMIYNATGKRPYFIGKPSPLMPELAMKIANVTAKETAVIGDRIYTDIKSGINAGTVSVLVMSGETDEQILKESKDKPDIVLSDAGEIIKGEIIR